MSFWKEDPPDVKPPLPPMANMDYESTIKFLQRAHKMCAKADKPFDPYCDWTIHVLLTSMASDNASRIFLSKAETEPFQLDNLIPMSQVVAHGTTAVNLSDSFVIAPIWNNAKSIQMIETLNQGDIELPDDDPVGIFIRELNMAIITKHVHTVYFKRYFQPGSILPLLSYRLSDIAKILQTDGEDWIVWEDGHLTKYSVLEPRMMTLYKVALIRFGYEDFPAEDIGR